MKTLHLHPYLTVSSLNIQLEQLIGCKAIIYSKLNDELKPFNTLGEAGFSMPYTIEYNIDETEHVRQFESDFLSQFNITMELCNAEMKPLTNKILRIFQLKPESGKPSSFSP